MRLRMGVERGTNRTGNEANGLKRAEVGRNCPGVSRSLCANSCCFLLKVENMFKIIKRMLLRQVTPRKPPELRMSQGRQRRGHMPARHA